jgi:hypothetical protein
MEDNIDDLVTDYLLGTMDPSTRMRFEQRLAEDPDLSARVALEQELATTLDASSPENQLRANLNQFSNKYQSLESLATHSGGRGRRIWWLLGTGLLLMGALAYWQFSQQGKTISQPNPELPPSIIEQETPHTPELEKTSPAKPQPIAAAYKPIPKLESYIGSQTRSGTLRLLVDEPKSGASFVRSANQVQFRLFGRVEGTVPTGTGLNLLIFTNNQKDFEDLRTVESQVLEISPNGNFQVQQQLALAPGLYYLMIEEQQSGEWLMVDRFFVKD